jgi:hypothetical protein
MKEATAEFENPSISDGEYENYIDLNAEKLLIII